MYIDITNLWDVIGEKPLVKMIGETMSSIESLSDLYHLPYKVIQFKMDKALDVMAVEEETDGVRQISFMHIIDDKNAFGVTFTIQESEPTTIIQNIMVNGILEDELTPETKYNMMTGFLPFFYATVLLNCKNVSLTIEPRAGIKQLLNKHNRNPKTIYKILKINPLSAKTKSEQESIETGIKRSLHTCRGHLRTYTDDKKLFGKYIGTYFIPAHVRGDIKNGKTIKDYKFNFATSDAN